MFKWLKDLLDIYTWKEFWLVMSVPAAIMGIWLVFYLLLSIPVTAIRAITIWALIFVLTLGAATADALRKQSGKRSS